jgi:hypothetical protein
VAVLVVAPQLHQALGETAVVVLVGVTALMATTELQIPAAAAVLVELEMVALGQVVLVGQGSWLFHTPAHNVVLAEP